MVHVQSDLSSASKYIDRLTYWIVSKPLRRLSSELPEPKTSVPDKLPTRKQLFDRPKEVCWVKVGWIQLLCFLISCDDKSTLCRNYCKLVVDLQLVKFSVGQWKLIDIHRGSRFSGARYFHFSVRPYVCLPRFRIGKRAFSGDKRFYFRLAPFQSNDDLHSSEINTIPRCIRLEPHWIALAWCHSASTPPQQPPVRTCWMEESHQRPKKWNSQRTRPGIWPNRTKPFLAPDRFRFLATLGGKWDSWVQESSKYKQCGQVPRLSSANYTLFLLFPLTQMGLAKFFVRKAKYQLSRTGCFKAILLCPLFFSAFQRTSWNTGAFIDSFSNANAKFWSSLLWPSKTAGLRLLDEEILPHQPRVGGTNIRAI